MIVRGNELRTMSPTEANATSSRSHAVLQINVSQKDRNADVNEPHTMATLSIIDLAGSERASATKNRGERLLEGANINKSLLALGSCINALCDPRKRNHVPYRNSKLTRLLKFSLGGNCRTVMIVCVSPSSAHFDETQNTLRYANRAKNIQTKVTRNVYNVNRHVKDFLKKIDEQMAMINELKQQQKDFEALAFGKFRKQCEKREMIAKEGITRLRSAYEHSAGERQDRTNTLRKLRQIERRISLIKAWTNALDMACDKNEVEEPSSDLAAFRKTALGTIAELEESRQHCHRRLAKNNWQRTIDSALQTGLKLLQDADDDDMNSSEAASLSREAELLKSNFEKGLYLQIAEEEKNGDAALIQAEIQQLLETVNVLKQITSMDEQDAMQTARKTLPSLIKSCVETTMLVMRQDGSLPVVESFPPLKTGTPRRKKRLSLMGPSSPKLRLAPPVIAQLISSPSRSNSPLPRRVKLGSAKKFGTPRRKSPKKKLVQWRDNTEDGKLEDFSKTPVQHEFTPEMPSTTDLPIPTTSENLSESEAFSSPIPAPPQTSIDMKPLRPDRFQSGFLSRRSHDSPAPPTLSYIPSSPDPSPLQEMSNNTASGRLSSDGSTRSNRQPPPTIAISADEKSSDSDEQGWTADRDDVKEISRAMKRASVSRSASTRESVSGRGIRRHRDSELKGTNVLSPRTAPVLKATSMQSGGGIRRATAVGISGGITEERTSSVGGAGIGGAGGNATTASSSAQRAAGGRVVSGGRLSVLPAGVGGSGSAGRGSMSSGGRIAWKFV